MQLGLLVALPAVCKPSFTTSWTYKDILPTVSKCMPWTWQPAAEVDCSTCCEQVIKLISQVIADFADGEIGQQARAFDTTLSIPEYMDKSFYKTATLIAASCKSAAVFSNVTVDVKNAMFEYGRHLGLAFQVVDDILDFTQSAAQLGKPQVRVLACL